MPESQNNKTTSTSVSPNSSRAMINYSTNIAFRTAAALLFNHQNVYMQNIYSIHHQMRNL
ncbi:hypothetical protein JHK82_013563 [Glycine max]|nr:hypothetical protein JHK82_013563 [Glycine max]KHM99964.1 hypothetical protein glysoja_017662 [Glycine soja]